MTDKEINTKSIIFVVIGILLLLSLVICIYIIKSERDLISVDSTVTNIVKDKEGTGKNDVTVMYEINGITYNYNFYYKDSTKIGDIITIYYHNNNITKIQTYRTSLIIFICPIIGLALCVIGIITLFKKRVVESNEKEYDTKIIGQIGNTRQLRIITDKEIIDYEQKEAETMEPEIKKIKKEEIVKSSNELYESPTKEKDILFEFEKKQFQIVPFYYYILNNTLVYKINSNADQKEKLFLKDINKITKTINYNNEVEKVVLTTANSIIVLNKIEKINLSKVTDLIIKEINNSNIKCHIDIEKV